MIIQNFQMFEKEDDFILQVEVKTADKLELLWFSTPLKYESHIIKTRMDGFLVGMLYPAMVDGEDIHVEGTVSEKLLHNLNTYVIPLLRCYSPATKSIRVTADHTDNSSDLHSNGVGTGFSGGIDSFTTVYDYLAADVPEDYKLTHFISMNVGAHGIAKTHEELARVRERFCAHYEQLNGFTNEIGFDFIPLDSNLHLFHHRWGHQKTCTLTAVAGILFFQSLFHRYYIASLGLTYGEIMVVGHMDMDLDISIFDPQLLPLLSTESLEFIPDGQQHNRPEKTSLIVDNPTAQRFLNVCASAANLSARNCSVCRKCKRTLATLRILGAEAKFKEVFDIDKYVKEVEKEYFAKLFFGGGDPFEKQISEFAKQRKTSLKRYTTAYHICMEALRLLTRWPRSQLRKIGWLRSLFHGLKNKRFSAYGCGVMAK